MRLLDYSTDGGCSKKAVCSELHSLLQRTGTKSSSQRLQKLSREMPDTGAFTLSSSATLSTVDVLLPMIDDAVLFGRITVNHVLNDVYASLARPQFALAILGVHHDLAADDPV